MNQDSGAGGRIRLPHNMFDVLFDRLFSDKQRIGNFLVRPSLRQMLDHRLFPIGQLESLLGMLRVQILLTAQFLHRDYQAGVLHSSPVWQPEAS